MCDGKEDVQQQLRYRNMSILTILGALLQFAVLIFKCIDDSNKAKEAKLNAQKKSISDAVASGDVSAINGAIQQLRR